MAFSAPVKLGSLGVKNGQSGYFIHRISPSTRFLKAGLRVRSSALGNDDGDMASFERGLKWVSEAGASMEKERLREEEETERRTNEYMKRKELAGKAGIKAVEFGETTHLQAAKFETTIKSYDENDPRRYVWHKKLHLCAEQGDFDGAEDVIRRMSNQNHAPGPKAYHALLMSYVKGNNPIGALETIRKQIKDAIQPLPQSYAALVYAFLQQGDFDQAAAVYDANRRSNVSSEKSWNALTTALFNSGVPEMLIRAVALLELGVYEGLQPDKRLYEAMIKYYCRESSSGDTHNYLSEALSALREMKKRGWLPDKDNFSNLVTAHALIGKAEEAERLLEEMLTCPGTATAPAVGAMNAMLNMYLEKDLAPAELAQKIARLRQHMVRGGIFFDRKGYSLLLKASVSLEVPEMGLLALKSLTAQGRGCTQYVEDDVIGDFLFQLGQAGNVEGIYSTLATLSDEQRSLVQDYMYTDDSGRSFITSWLSDSFEEDGQEDAGIDSEDQDDYEDAPKAFIAGFEGVYLDPDTKCAVDASGKQLAVTKMSVKELRAELIERKVSVRGNKRELVRQLQKARAEAEVLGATYSGGKEQVKRVEVVVMEESWSIGNLVHQNIYEDEREINEDEDEDDDTVEDVVDEEEDTQLTLDDDDDLDFDYEDRVDTMMKAQGKFKSAFTAKDHAGIAEAVTICEGVIALGGQPSEADLLVLRDTRSRLKNIALKEKIDSLLSWSRPESNRASSEE